MRVAGDRHHRYGLALAALAAAIACLPARAEWSASLPALAACTVARPELPARWRAVALMMPFHEGQLDIGEFVYDGSLPAMRASVYGLESGAVDLLITNGDSYRLTGPHHAPTGCTSLGRRWRVPSAHWLSDKAVCVGRKKLAARVVRWWKMPGRGEQATYHWFTASTRLPWRSLFLRPAAEPAVIGDYAMTYYPEFAPLAQTNLSSLLDLCGAKAAARDAEATAPVPPARELMDLANEVPEAEREERIGALIPGLSHQGCARMTAVRWPDKFIMTAMLTPIRFDEAPYSSMIYYDWRQAETQLAVMFQGQGQTPKLQGVVSLKKGIGYRVDLDASKRPSCDAVFPGIVRPDWMSAAGCRCRGTIAKNSSLGPEAETQILSCPIKDQERRIMWNWYTVGGRPLLFFEAAPVGGGVMLADYSDWLPGRTGTPTDFKLPPVCMPANPNAPAHTRATTSCADCHTVAR
jgi:hypothetical protein